MEEAISNQNQQSIYKLARCIKRKDNSLYNALRSIYEDSIFVDEISQLWPQLPLLANLRCGLWYSSNFHSTCYFKSTDGHNNNWSFNTSRLNLHVALLAAHEGGCIIVDSTRKGKRFPDSMSKTIPIWACVLNRCVLNYLNKMSESSSSEKENRSSDWDCSLHLPLWVSKTERASIEGLLEGWTSTLETSGADIESLALSLKKPLCPLWVSHNTVIWLNEVPKHDSWDFTPVILINASSSIPNIQRMTTSEHSWNYIPGAGDDEESWARALTPGLFWKNAYDIINSGPEACNQKVAEIVERDRVQRAQRGQNAPQISVKLSKDLGTTLDMCMCLNSKDTHIHDGENVSWIWDTNLAVGAARHANAADVECTLNCGVESVSNSPGIYIHLPIMNSKMDRFSLLNNLPCALQFAKSNLTKGKKLLVCCNDGEDISVCVCLAILISLYDDKGNFDDGDFFHKVDMTKLELRKRLVMVCKYVLNARPSRGNLRQVFIYLTGKKAVQESHNLDDTLLPQPFIHSNPTPAVTV